MPLPQIPTFNLPTTLGRALTINEAEALFTTLRSYHNALAALLDVTIEPDGKLQDDIVIDGKIKDRVVGRQQLKFTSCFLVEDTGAVNALQVTTTPAPTSAEVLDSGDYVDGILLFVKVAATNSAPATLEFGGHGAAEIKKQGGVSLIGGELEAGSVVALVSSGGEWLLVAGSGGGGSSSSQTVNFTGLTQFQDAVAIPDPGGVWVGVESVSILHGLDKIPDRVQISLRCLSADAGHAAGDMVDIGDFYDNATAEPAFSVQVTQSAITINRLVENVYVKAPAGTEAAIDAATPDWDLYIVAEKTVGTVRPVLPSTSFMLNEPHGGITYGNNLYTMLYQRSALQYRLVKVNLATSAVTHVHTFAAAANYPSYTIQPLAAGPHIIIKTTGDAYKLNLADDSVTVYHSSLHDDQADAVMWVDETPSTTYPTIYTLRNGWGVGYNAMKSLYAKRHLWGGASYGGGGAWYGAALNLIDGPAYSNRSALTDLVGTGDSEVWRSIWNPVKRRLYILTRDDFYCHIFNIGGSDNFGAWWISGARESVLGYEKSVILPFHASALADGNYFRVSLEIDPVSGGEVGWTLWQRWNTANANHPGTVAIAPWRE